MTCYGVCTIPKANRADKRLLEYESSAYGYLVNGLVAQLGEHLSCKQKVEGSTPFESTNKDRHSKPKRLKIFYFEEKLKWFKSTKYNLS